MGHTRIAKIGGECDNTPFEPHKDQDHNEHNTNKAGELRAEEQQGQQSTTDNLELTEKAIVTTKTDTAYSFDNPLMRLRRSAAVQPAKSMVALLTEASKVTVLLLLLLVERLRLLSLELPRDLGRELEREPGRELDREPGRELLREPLADLGCLG